MFPIFTRTHLLVAMLTLSVTTAMVAAADTPTYQDPDALPAIKELPDPFVMGDGSRVKTPEDWDRRREELKELVLGYEYGRMPPAPGNVKGKVLESKTDPATGVRHERVQLTMGPEGKIQATVDLSIPATGEGPFPVVVRGDACWGPAAPEIVAEATGRGYILADFDRTQFAPDNADRSVGVYPHYPDYDWRALSAWAWGFHRVVDYLVTRDDVDKEKIAVTGHSRGGKTALLAGATDERIALTVPNNSGAGGAGCFRFQADKSEDIAAITKNFPFWFAPTFPQFIGKIDRLPFDQHSVKALVAPRALLSTEALGDLWANPEGTQQSHLASKEVFEFLGAGDRIGLVYRPGEHEHNLDDWKVLLDYADKVFLGKDVGRKFDELAFPDSPKSFSWAAPPRE